MSADSLARFSDTLRRLHDARRPVRLAEVVDQSLYTAAGAGYLGVLIDGARVYAICRDMALPALGASVQVVRMASDPTAEWLILQPPLAGAGLLLSMISVGVDPYDAAHQANDDYRIIAARLDSGAWEKRSDHPITYAVWEECVYSYNDPDPPDFGMVWLPLARVGDAYLTWARYDELQRWDYDGTHFTTYPNPSEDREVGRVRALKDGAPNCYRSTDGGRTWALAATIRAVRWVEAGAGGAAYAVCDDGETIYTSTDDGATWTLVYTIPSVTASLRNRIGTVAPDPDTPGVVAFNRADGVYTTTDDFATTPSSPAGNTLYYDDTSVVILDGDGNPIGNVVYLVDNYPAASLARHGDATLLFHVGNSVAAQVGDDHSIRRDPDPPGTFVNETDAPEVFNGAANRSGFWRVGEAIYLANQSAEASLSFPTPVWLWRSDDGGDTWTEIGVPPKSDGTAAPRASAGSGLWGRPDGLYAVGSVGTFSPVWRDNTAGEGPLGRRLFRLDGDGVWRDQTGTMQADIGNYAPFAHGAATVDS